MPLMLFILLGTLQLFLMLHARILTQLAAFQVTRTASLNHGNCPRMLHAGILQVLPAIEPFVRPSGNLALNVAGTFRKYRNNRYPGQNVNIGSGTTSALTGEVMWIIRDIGGREEGQPSPRANEHELFDQSQAPMRMETQVVFWFPMRIPFANWVIARIMLAHYGIQAYANQNPLVISQRANWRRTSRRPPWFLQALKRRLGERLLNGEYVFPIVATYTMRMMTPLKATNMLEKNCRYTPNYL